MGICHCSWRRETRARARWAAGARWKTACLQTPTCPMTDQCRRTGSGAGHVGQNWSWCNRRLESADVVSPLTCGGGMGQLVELSQQWLLVLNNETMGQWDSARFTHPGFRWLCMFCQIARLSRARSNLSQPHSLSNCHHCSFASTDGAISYNHELLLLTSEDGSSCI